MFRKIGKIILLKIYIAGVFGIIFLPNLVFAQSNSNELLQLKQLVLSLQSQVASLQSGNYFLRDLKEGDVGVDVYRLQVFLNKNVFTRVAIAGPGSPGNETQFFGSLTTAAVQRFQELNREQILTPVGLTKGTGFVGPSTRKVLNSSFYVTPAIIPTTSQTVNMVSEELKVVSISPEKAGNATQVTITGEGFEKTNDVLTTFQIFPDIVSTDGKTLKVKLDFDFLDDLPSESEINSLKDSLLEDDLSFTGEANIVGGGGGFSDLGYLEIGQAGFNEVPIYIIIKNSKGESQPIKFTLTL